MQTQKEEEEERMETGDEKDEQHEGTVQGAAGASGQQGESMDWVSGGEGTPQQGGVATGSTGGDGQQQQQGESMEWTAGKSGQPEQEEVGGGAGAGGQQQQDESMEGAAGGAGPASQEEPMDSAAGGAGPAPQDESMQEAAGGAGPAPQEESMEGAAGGSGPSPQEGSVGTGAGSEGTSVKKESQAPSPSSGEGAAGAAAPAGEGSSSSHTPPLERPSGKRREKKKHLEPPRPRTPPPAEPKKGDDSDDEEIQHPMRFPTGQLYDTKPKDLGARPKVRPPPPEPKKSSKRKQQDDKAKEPPKPPAKTEKAVKTQVVKLKALMVILDEVLDSLEALAPDASDEERRSAVALVAEVEHAARVQNVVARQAAVDKDPEGEVAEACVLIDAVCAAARDCISRNGGVPPGVEIVLKERPTEDDRGPISVRLLVLQLSKERLTKTLEEVAANPTSRKIEELKKFYGMAQTLIQGTGKMGEELRQKGNHAGGRFIDVYLERVRELYGRVGEALEAYRDSDDDSASDKDESFVVPVFVDPTQMAQTLLNEVLMATGKLSDAVALLESGADAPKLRKNVEACIVVLESLLRQAETTVGGDGVEPGVVMTMFEVAGAAQEKLKLARAVLESTKW
ncbi:hypothetical protein, conserved [Eimeria brunetti]|uniref:Uncharacterized protein n=1 Tax=Eimeria brunetti TaxID=51314 RepID=U6LMM8_9EIME|nr:hypothetical protein, conserved [Eimeria brunetti]